MNAKATARFWRGFGALPTDAQRQAEDAYRRWATDPFHRSLEFKRISTGQPIYSVRIGLHWRALGAREGDTIIWFWIGSHAEYDHLLKRL